jgi:high-affinity nickel-transport protein
MSVIVAVVVGGALAFGLIAEKLGLQGGVWDAISGFNDLSFLGFLIVGLFVASWLVSMLIYRLRGYDRLELRVTSTPADAALPQS